MMPFARESVFAALVVLCGAFQCGRAATAQSPVWISDWRVAEHPSWPSAGWGQFAVSSQGEVVYATPSSSGLDYQYTRLDASGALRWSVNVGNGFYSEFGGSMPSVLYADGSAVVAFEQSYGAFGRMAGIGADGTVRWIRQTPISGLAALPATRVMASDCFSVSIFDAQTGSLEWHYGAPFGSGTCVGDNVVVDNMANIYAVFPIAGGGMRTVKLDSDGYVLWDVASAIAPSTIKGPAVGASSGLLFVRDADMVRALHVADGSEAWTIPCISCDVVLAGSPAEAIVSEGAELRRLANDGSGDRWHVTLPQFPSRLSSVDGQAYALMGGTLTRFDVGTGGISWQTPLPEPDEDGNLLGELTIAAGGTGLVAIGGWVRGYAGSAPFVAKFQTEDGQAAGAPQFPAVAQGVTAASVTDGTDHVVDAALSADADHWNLRVRRLASANGETVWESTVPLEPASGWFSDTVGRIAAVSVSPTSVAVEFFTSSLVGVATLDLSSGNLLWSRPLPEPSAQAIYPAAPVIDSIGNVYIDYGVFYLCSPYSNCCPPLASGTCSAQKLYKLSAVDGSTAWQRGGVTTAGDVSNPVLALADPDVIVGGTLAADLASAALVRLSGADGTSIGWSSTIFSAGIGVYDIHSLPNHKLFVSGQGWAKLNAVTGATVWQSAPVSDPMCSDASCHEYDRIVSPDGDLYTAGESKKTVRIARLHGDGSGVADYWYPLPSVAGNRIAATQIRQDSNGLLWLRLTRSAQGPHSLTLLATFDPVTGTLSAQRTIGIFDSASSPQSIKTSFLFDAPELDKVLVQTLVSAPPAPATYGDALLSIAPTQEGDLGATVSLENTHVVLGGTAEFHFRATYSGDAPLVGARLIGSLPWPSGLDAVVCTPVMATNCVVGARSDEVDATFDIEPGGSIEITGTVRVVDVAQNNEAPILQVVTFGPPGLTEADTQNNFASLKAKQSLFFDGFD